jgi:chaperonin GroEL
MEAKDIRFGDEIHQKILLGTNCLANAVKTTMGPKGRYVVVARGYDTPLITKDGMTVAQQIELADRFENAGAQAVKQAALRTADTAGDGSTTAIVIAQAIIQEGMKFVTVGMNPMALKRGIDQAVAAAVAELGRLSRPCTTCAELRQVGMIAANGEQAIGDIMAEALRLVGASGTVLIEEGQSSNDEIVMAEGMQLACGFLSSEFASKESLQTVFFENACIALIGDTVSSPDELLPLLELIGDVQLPVLIVAEDFSDQILTVLTVNNARGALKAPGIGSQRRSVLEDLALLTGGVLICPESGLRLQDVTLTHLGRAKRIEVTRDSTTVVGGKGDRGLIAARIRYLQAQLGDASGRERTGLEQRIAMLAGGVATVKVGASTEMALKERKQRMEDALRAMRAAREEGIVPGGGVALLRTRAVMEQLKDENLDFNAGVDIMLRAVEAPLCQIAANAGAEPLVVIARVAEQQGNFGFNAATSQYGDVITMGVLDSTKVVRTALQNAASVAGLMLTTECMVVGRADSEAMSR